MLSAAGANAGTSSAAPASSSAAAAAVLKGSVFVKQFGVGDAVYAEVDIYVGDKVARLAERAFAKFRWPGAANKVKLYLVKQTGDDEPTAEEEKEAIKRPRLGVGLSLLRAGIASGAWVVAGPSPPSEASAGAAPAPAPGLAAAPAAAASAAEGPAAAAGRAAASAATFTIKNSPGAVIVALNLNTLYLHDVTRQEFPAAAAGACTRAARRSLLMYLSSRGREGACARLFRSDLCRRSQ
jgi:hypothetical protein